MSYKSFCDVCGADITGQEKSYVIGNKLWVFCSVHYTQLINWFKSYIATYIE